MDVILLERVRNLGNLGDEVSVKNGYGRNFLIPQGKAVRATAANREVFESRRAELEAQAAGQLKAAEDRAAGLAELAVTIAARASDEGKLFGSVGSREIADAVTKRSGGQQGRSAAARGSAAEHRRVHRRPPAALRCHRFGDGQRNPRVALGAGRCLAGAFGPPRCFWTGSVLGP